MRIIFAFFMFVSFSAVSGEPVVFVTDPTSCTVKERGHASKHNSLEFKGEKWEMEGASGCIVPVAKKSFEQKFSFCFLTGVKFMSAGYCTFNKGKHHGDDAYIFDFDDKEALNCEFTCIEL